MKKLLTLMLAAARINFVNGNLEKVNIAVSELKILSHLLTFPPGCAKITKQLEI